MVNVNKAIGFVYVIVRGSPYERGYKYGDEVKDTVKRNLSYYFSFWKRRFNLEKETILRKAEKVKEAIEKFDHSILEEIKGIADGSQNTLDEIVALNARYEFLWISASLAGCTSVLALPGITVNNQVLLGQNWDYKPPLLENSVLLQVERKDGPNILTHVEAGCVGRTGFNSKGIGLCVNALVSSNDKYEPKVPFHVLCRSILDSGSLSEAIGRSINSERALSYNFLIASGEGVGVDIELLPEKNFNHISPKDGFLVHTNHFLKVASFNDEFIKVIPDTLVRYQRVNSILKSVKDKVSCEDLTSIFRDHLNYPNSVCRHPDSKLGEDDQIATLASIIMNLSEMRMFITKGPPCKINYCELKIS